MILSRWSFVYNLIKWTDFLMLHYKVIYTAFTLSNLETITLLGKRLLIYSAYIHVTICVSLYVHVTRYVYCHFMCVCVCVILHALKCAHQCVNEWTKHRYTFKNYLKNIQCLLFYIFEVYIEGISVRFLYYNKTEENALDMNFILHFGTSLNSLN